MNRLATKNRLVSVLFFGLLALSLCGAQAAFAALADRGDVVPVDPPLGDGGGFPAWYMDQNGTALMLCLGNAALCLADPVDPANPTSVAAGFGTEAFYWGASATAVSGGASCDLILALEAAFGTGTAAPNQQMVFSRLRLSCDGLSLPGRYTFLHPFGQRTLTAEPDPGAPGLFRILGPPNTIDIGIVPRQFDRALASQNVGPFLRSVSPPRGFLGNPNLLQRITGSPMVPPRNSFTVTGPGGFSATTNLFNIEGKRATNGGVTINRASYSRAATGEGAVDVVASSIGGQVIRVSGVGTPPVVRRMTADPNIPGRYATSIPFTAGAVFSPITARNVTAIPDALATANVRDVVTISEASWTAATQRLLVRAASSDLLPRTSGGPRLEVFNGAQSLGFIQANGAFALITPVAPTRVTVRSSAGGIFNKNVVRQ